MADDLHPAIAARLDDDGQRYTSGRRRLVEVLVDAGRPLTAAEVLVEGDLAQSSAYRNLAVLEACGVVTASPDPTSSPASSWPKTSPTTTITT